MYGKSVLHHRIAPSASSLSMVAALLVDERDRDEPLVSIPRAEIHIVARFGPAIPGGLDVHVLGVRPKVHRKTVRRGQRTVAARLQLGATEAVLGVPASALAGRIVALEDLWGEAATRRLRDRLSRAVDTRDAAVILERAIAERQSTADHRRVRSRLALDAADRLTSTHVNTVADDLGVSERHLRRVFRETVGVSPKTFARLARFQRALLAASQNSHRGWAHIAAATGYYDQAHLIAEFREIAGVTPSALLIELGVCSRHLHQL